MGVSLLQGQVLEPGTADLPCIRTPLSIYVLWHPAFSAGRDLASAVYRWFGDATDDVRRVGLGIPVHFRSKDWPPRLDLADTSAQPPITIPERPVAPHAQAAYDVEYQVRRPINLDGSIHNVMVPLVDDHMVADPSWRRDLLAMVGAAEAIRKGGHPSVLHLVAVQVSDALTRLPELFSSIQPIRLDRWDDPDVDSEDMAKTRRARFCRLLTQALVRRLRAGSGDRSRLPHQVFVSHAKRDLHHGPGIAEQIRNTAAGYGQIAVFYDENSLDPGESWRGTMLGSAASGGAFIAVQSDSYSSRYWCRREVQAARTPQAVDEPTVRGVRSATVWGVQPSVVIAAFDGRWTRLLPELGSAPTVRWGGDHAAEEVLDGLFREAILAEVQVMYARQLREAWLRRGGRSREHLHVITWTPDASTLLRLQGLALEAGRWGDRVTVAYPGHGLLPTEEELVRSSFGGRVRFRPFEAFGEELVHGSTEASADHQLTIDSPVFSLAAGDPGDLAELGYDDGAQSVHLNAATLRIAMALFRSGARIVSAGQLRQGQGFLDMLVDAADASFPDGINRRTDAVSPLTPLENLVRWPVVVSAQRRSQEHGRTTFIDVPPPGWGWAERATVPGDLSGHHARWAEAATLVRTRRLLASSSDVMLMLGGKVEGWSGVMPGLAEELLCACEEAAGMGGDLPAEPVPESFEAHRRSCDLLGGLPAAKVRVLIIGAFGGMAREIAGVLLRDAFRVPDSCILRKARVHPDNGKLQQLWRTAAEPQRLWIAQRYERLQHALHGLHSVAWAESPLLHLGLECWEWRMLMRTDSVGDMRRLLQRRVVPAVRAAPGPGPRPGGG